MSVCKGMKETHNQLMQGSELWRTGRQCDQKLGTGNYRFSELVANWWLAICLTTTTLFICRDNSGSRCNQLCRSLGQTNKSNLGWSQLSPCGHPVIRDACHHGQNPDPSENCRGLTGLDSCYYGLSLQWNYRYFRGTKMTKCTFHVT